MRTVVLVSSLDFSLRRFRAFGLGLSMLLDLEVLFLRRVSLTGLSLFS
jgi:hypothetical protein